MGLEWNCCVVLRIHLQSNHGIGDVLLLTPTFRVIKEAYPNCKIVVSSRHRDILTGNPYVYVDGARGGFHPFFPDPHSGVVPVQHHIFSLWESVCNESGLKTYRPEIKPEIYIPGFVRGGNILVQVLHRMQWGGKKVWPYFRELSSMPGFSAIQKMDSLQGLVQVIRGAKLVVCAEGLISHIAQAVGTKAIVIYGGFLRPEWNGYADQINIVSPNCSEQCYNSNPCSLGKVCFSSISVDYVESVVRENV